MAVLFVSHASRDDVTVNALEAWLRAKGFTDLFIDHSNIDAGENWAQELRAATGACRVVLCLVTENWLASDECFSEFRGAWYMRKRIVPLFALGPGGTSRRERLEKVRAEDQGLDVAPCLTLECGLDLARDPEIERRLESGLRAGGALAKIGLDPEGFAIDRQLRRTPFPGLSSFGDEDADAALFYGRSLEIAGALEELREMRAKGDLRPYVILGASGSGKSSLLKAGIIPRLRREAPAWLPLRAFRPGGDPLLNFAEAIARTLASLKQPEAHGAIRDRLLDAWTKVGRPAGKTAPKAQAALQAALDDLGGRLRRAAGRPGATILIGVDQAEELARADGESGDALATYLRAASAMTASRWQIALTIRTDSFPELQKHGRFEEWEARPRDLRAVKEYRFDSLIEEPARRYGVRVDTQLVEALIEDAPKEDALPLLAFGLQRLWLQYAASGALVLDNYVRVGRLRGLIEDGAERALRGLSPEEDVALPSAPPPKSRLDLAASTFVPALAQVNEQGATIRRIADWASFSDEQRELLARFEQWRLIVRKGDAGTVEVTHEALFREWTRLRGWLEPERTRLEALRSLQLDALIWDRKSRDAAFLNHRDKRLTEAKSLIGVETYRKRLGKLEVDYLSACQAARTRRLLRGGGMAALGVGAVTLVGLNQSYLIERAQWFAIERPYVDKEVQPHVLLAEIERAMKPGASFRECARDTSCPGMIVVPAGEFMMGSPVTEPLRYPPEGPQHKVKISRPFAVSKFDVTFDDWDACVSVGGCPEVDDLTFRRGKKPLINVNWTEAQQYVAWLSKMTGKPYRLLTEAEWEYAARAGATTAYYWGDQVGEGNANCDGCGSKWDRRSTSPVGSFSPNAFGLYDMAGNVWQWVADCNHDTYEQAPTDGSEWPGGDCAGHIMRGGSWLIKPPFLRSAFRVGAPVDGRHSDLGFRVARTINP
jgi:formylglycine-generating enzyme required for sulfatase activity